MTDEYKRYMKSPAWESIKAKRMAIDGYKCVMCGRNIHQVKSMQVHHIHYKDLGHEDVYNSLVTLCGSCHVKIHNYYKRKRA